MTNLSNSLKLIDKFYDYLEEYTMFVKKQYNHRIE